MPRGSPLSKRLAWSLLTGDLAFTILGNIFFFLKVALLNSGDPASMPS
jgi:hypothetical protein